MSYGVRAPTATDRLNVACPPASDRRPVRPRQRDTDHGVAGHDGGELLLAPTLRALGPHRHHHESRLLVGVVDAYLHVERQLQPELGEHLPGLTGHPAPVVRRSVPRWRHAQDGPRVAGAQGAHDHVVHLRRVLEDVEIRVVAGRALASHGDRPLPAQALPSRPWPGVASVRCSGSGWIRRQVAAAVQDEVHVRRPPWWRFAVWLTRATPGSPGRWGGLPSCAAGRHPCCGTCAASAAARSLSGRRAPPAPPRRR